MYESTTNFQVNTGILGVFWIMLEDIYYLVALFVLPP